MAQNEPVKAGDVTRRVGVEVIQARGVDVEKLIKMLVANAAAEFASTYYYYTILRMHLAGHEDYKEICEDARLEDRAHWELIVPRIYELGGELPNDLPAFHDQAGCRAAKLPDPPTGPQDPECEFAATKLTLPTRTRYVGIPPLAVVLVPQRILTPANTSTREANQAGGIAARTSPERPRAREQSPLEIKIKLTSRATRRI